MAAKISLIREIIMNACRRSTSPVRTTCSTPFSTTTSKQSKFKNLNQHQTRLQNYLGTNQKKSKNAACQSTHPQTITYSLESNPNAQSPGDQNSRNRHTTFKRFYTGVSSPIQAKIKTTPKGLLIEVTTVKDNAHRKADRAAFSDATKMRPKMGMQSGLEFQKLSVTDVKQAKKGLENKEVIDKGLVKKKAKTVENVNPKLIPKVIQKTDKFQVTHESQHYSMAARLEQLQPSKLTNFTTVDYSLANLYN